MSEQTICDAPRHPSELVDSVGASVVGRRREIELVVAALVADRHVVIEGPPGTGKSTLLRTVAHELGVGFEFVEGNAELTPARLVGHFDPARVMAEAIGKRKREYTFTLHGKFGAWLGQHLPGVVHLIMRGQGKSKRKSGAQ